MRRDKKHRKLVEPLDDGTDRVEIWHTEEKGSDVNLGAFLILDGARDDYEKAIVVTNDGDLGEPLRLVADELSKRLTLVYPSQEPNGRLVSATSDQMRLSRSTVRQCQLPDPFELPNGKQLTKPTSW